MSDELGLNITLTRQGGPGAEWEAFVDDGDPHRDGVPYGPASSPGEVLEEIGQALDDAEATAIVAARAAGEG